MTCTNFFDKIAQNSSPPSFANDLFRGAEITLSGCN